MILLVWCIYALLENSNRLFGGCDPVNCVGEKTNPEDRLCSDKVVSGDKCVRPLIGGGSYIGCTNAGNVEADCKDCECRPRANHQDGDQCACLLKNS